VFAGVIVLGQLSPGPDMILVTRTALRKGVREGVETAAGIACGLTVHATIAVAGVAMTFQRLPLLRMALQWVAAIYLLWLAYGILRERFIAWYSGAVCKVELSGDARRPFVRGMLCNLFNPKVALFLAAVCAPFLYGNHPAWWPFAIWFIIVGMGFSVWAWWVFVLQWRPLRRAYEHAAQWLDAVFGLILLGLAVRLMIGW
jgi:threonine/homoserine/homoserine lactone efflux protein